MSRAERLLDLIQLLRAHRRPVSGAALAAELGIALRTLYRDIAALTAQGATIDGEPGVGYMLRPGFLLPPLMRNSADGGDPSSFGRPAGSSLPSALFFPAAFAAGGGKGER